MSNAIGHWNPAWGPEPAKVKDRPPPDGTHKSAWYRVWCPLEACAHHEGVLVYAWGKPRPCACAACGREMHQERVSAYAR